MLLEPRCNGACWGSSRLFGIVAKGRSDGSLRVFGLWGEAGLMKEGGILGLW